MTVNFLKSIKLPPWKWQLVWWITGASMSSFALLFLIYGWNEAGVRQLIQWSGRISFTLFCLAFSASGLHALLRQSWTWWLRMNRKFIGISFALVHLVHLLWVALLQWFFHPVFELAADTSLLGGGIAYLFVVLMLATSFEKIAGMVSGKMWKAIHLFGGYWIWAIFFSTYFKRADTEPIHWIGVIALAGILAVRLRKRFFS